MCEIITMRPIGTMRSVFHYKNGTPRQSSLCEAARGILTIDKSIFNNPEHSLEGLQQFSHAWIIFVFHKNKNLHTKAKVKPPRLDGQRVGVFSTRSPYRPNNIGLSLVKIDRVDGCCIHFSGIDLLDGTPVLDIKPYIPEYDKPKDSNSYSSSGEMKEVFTVGNVVTSTRENTDNVVTVGDVIKSTLEITDTLKLASSQVQEKTTDVIHGEDLRTAVNKHCLDLYTKDDLLQNIVTDSDIHPVTDTDTQPVTDSDIHPVTDSNIQPVTDSDTQCPAKKVSEFKQYKMTSVNKKAFPKQNKSSLDHSESATGEATYDSDTATVSTVVAPWLLNPPVVQLRITFTQEALLQLNMFSQQASDPGYRLHMIVDSQEAKRSIAEIIQEDPRSVYRRQHCQDSLYYFTLDVLHITCWFDDNMAQVIRIKPVTLVPKLVHTSDKAKVKVQGH